MAETDQDIEDREELLDDIERYFEGHRNDVERRHWVQALAMVGLLGSGARELYRSEVLRALPSLRYRSGGLEGEEWELSWHPNPENVPEGLSEASGYAALLALASVGGDKRADRHPLLSMATAGLSVFQAVSTLRGLVKELESGSVDAFSSIDTIVSASTVPLVLPEAVRAIKGLFRST